MEDITYIVRRESVKAVVSGAEIGNRSLGGLSSDISDLPSLEQCQEIINEIDCMIAEL